MKHSDYIKQVLNFYKNKKCIVCGKELRVNKYNGDLSCEEISSNKSFISHFFIGNNPFLFNIQLGDLYVDVKFKDDCDDNDSFKVEFYKPFLMNDIDMGFLQMIFDNIDDCSRYYNNIYENLLLLG